MQVWKNRENFKLVYMEVVHVYHSSIFVPGDTQGNLWCRYIKLSPNLLQNFKWSIFVLYPLSISWLVKPDLRPVRTGASNWIDVDWTYILDQLCPHLIHIAQKWIISGLKLDWANPGRVGGLDLDRKWIITGNEIFTWQGHSLIEAHVCRNVERSLNTQETHCCIYGSRQCPKPAGCNI